MKTQDRHALLKSAGLGLVACVALAAWSSAALAQQTQIPTLQVCNFTRVGGGAQVFIQARSDSSHSGMFRIDLKLYCDAKEGGIPHGDVRVTEIGLNDSSVGASFVSTLIEQVTSAGKRTPMAFLNGRCTTGKMRCR